jgi:hypothetical protein
MCHQCTRDTYHGADTFVVSDMPLR